MSVFSKEELKFFWSLISLLVTWDGGGGGGGGGREAESRSMERRETAVDGELRHILVQMCEEENSDDQLG